jgi:hypothetical protein
VYEVGSAYLTIVPSFKNIQRELGQIARSIGREVDKSIAEAIPQGVREGAARAATESARQGKRAGDKFGGSFVDEMNRRLTNAAKSIREIKITADSTDAERAIADVRKDILELRDATVNLEVDSDFAMLEFERIREKIRELQREDATIEAHFNMAQALAELEALAKTLGRAGGDAGEEFSDHFARTVRARLAATRGIFLQVDVDVDDSEVAQDVAAINTILAQIDERIRTEVDLNEAEVLRDVEIVEQALRRLATTSPSVRIRTNAARVLAEVEAIARMFRDQQIEQNKLHQEALEEDKRRDEARERFADNERRRITDQRRMLREAYEENARRDNESLERQRRLRTGAFGDSSRRRVVGAREALPEVDPQFRTRQVFDDMARLRAELALIGDLEIGVNIDAATFQAQIAAIIAELEAIEANEVDIDVVANARAALAELRALVPVAEQSGEDAGEEWGGSFVREIRQAVRAAAATITDIEIGVDTTDAQFDLAELRARLTALGNVDIGVDMSLAEFIREVTFIEQRLADLEFDAVDIQVRLEAAAARAGLTALHNQINEVDRDDIRVDVDVDGASRSLRQMASDAGVSMSRLGLLISLGASLGTAIVPAAAAVAASFSAIAFGALTALSGVGVFALGIFGVVKAVQALSKYQNDADKSAQNLSASQARVAGAMDQVKSAQQGLRSSQRNLTRAEEDAVQAVKDLVKAREDARRQLEDMRLAVKDTALAIRQGRLDEAEAKKELDAVLANPKATEAEREQARITYEERVLQMEELTLRQQRQTKEQTEATKKGVEGSDQVKAAQERIAAAMERIIDAQDSVASSHRAVEAANRALAQSYEKTGVAGGDALRNLQEAMDNLSPAGQRFALFIFGLRGEFKKLQAAAEEGLLPGLQTAITNLLPYLEPLRGFVKNVAQALGDGFIYATEALKDPVWQEFFGYLSATAGPVLRGMFEFTMNVAKGIAGIMLGLSGFNGPIGEGVLQWSRDFAEWGATLDSNQGWQKFIQYVKDSWPEVRDFFSGLWDFTKKFVAAAAPVGEWVVGAFAKLFEWMNKLDTGTWTIIIAAIAGVGAALLTIAGVTSLITTGWAGLIVALIGVIAAEWAVLYEKVKPVRDIMQALWTGTGQAFSFLWERILKPGFAALMAAMDVLWREVLLPLGQAFGTVFGAAGAILSRLWQVAGPILGFIGDALRFLGGVLLWLWTHAFKYVFDLIVIGLQVVWSVFQIMLGVFQIGIKLWAGLFVWTWEKIIQPFWNFLKPFFQYLADVIRIYVYPPFKRGMELLGAAWKIFSDMAKVPIKFIIETVLNNGVLAAYNKVAGFFHVKPDNVKVDMPGGFARGGAVHGRGTATSDSIVARLSNGEHIMTADEVTKLGGQDQVYRLRSMIRNGVLPGFAAGGAVTKSGDESWFDKLRKKAGDVIGGVKDFFSDPTASLKELLDKLVGLAPDRDSPAAKIALGLPAKVLGILLDKVKDLTSWGGDSGIVPITGGPAPGFLPWPRSPGAQRGNTGVWKSIVGLIQSTGPVSGSFGNAYRPGDPLWHGSGRAVDWMGFNQDALSMFFMNQRGRLLEFIHRTNRRDYAVTRGRDRGSFSNSLMQAHRNHVHVAMDQGGWLEPGWTQIYNGTGMPEAVLTNKQWNAMAANPRGGDGASAPQYHFQFRDTTLDPGKLRAIQDREAAMSRAGRAR